MKKLLFALLFVCIGLQASLLRHTKVRIAWVDLEKQAPKVGDKIIISDGKNIMVVKYEANALLWKLNWVKRWMLARNIEGASDETP